MPLPSPFPVAVAVAVAVGALHGVVPLPGPPVRSPGERRQHESYTLTIVAGRQSIAKHQDSSLHGNPPPLSAEQDLRLVVEHGSATPVVSVAIPRKECVAKVARPRERVPEDQDTIFFVDRPVSVSLRIKDVDLDRPCSPPPFTAA